MTDFQKNEKTLTSVDAKVFFIILFLFTSQKLQNQKPEG